ncbi:MAG: hypothetical protein ACR2H3_12255 [Acidimicrobiales bacterium]
MSTTQPLNRPGVTTPRPAARVEADAATRAFSLSMLISGVRCVLAYVIFPWVLPAIGHAGGIGPGLGVVVGVVAITSNVFSIRRFMRSGHRWRWHISVVNASVIGLLSYLLVVDLLDLLG